MSRRTAADILDVWNAAACAYAALAAVGIVVLTLLALKGNP